MYRRSARQNDALAVRGDLHPPDKADHPNMLGYQSATTPTNSISGRIVLTSERITPLSTPRERPAEPPRTTNERSQPRQRLTTHSSVAKRQGERPRTARQANDTPEGEGTSRAGQPDAMINAKTRMASRRPMQTIHHRRNSHGHAGEGRRERSRLPPPPVTSTRASN